MKPMLPTLAFEPPTSKTWSYEIKYDGYRALLFIHEDFSIQLISRNGNSLLEQFPEIPTYLHTLRDRLEDDLPLILDGELVILDSPFKANFSKLQNRGRLQNKEKISAASANEPCKYLAFDLLKWKNIDYLTTSYLTRKERLKEFFDSNRLQATVGPELDVLQFIQQVEDFKKLWTNVKAYKSEGVIAKRNDSNWKPDKRVKEWLKIKNYQKGLFFLLKYDKKNGYLHVGVIRNHTVFQVGLVSHGMSSTIREALLQVIKANKSNEDNEFLYVPKGICMELSFLELYKEQLREPRFIQFRFDRKWQECTWEKLYQNDGVKVLKNQDKQKNEVEITNKQKPVWPTKNIVKADFIQYLQQIEPYLLPFLENRWLTVIRFPHGVEGESFFQKNCPNYAPDFVKTDFHDNINYIVCNDHNTLRWLGNQLAIEFHIPFETVKSNGPSEIVFDLDPPSRKMFHLAVHAALIIQETCKGLGLISFVKTSGNKGLQIYIPLPENNYSYEDTRLFTKFIADFLTEKEPHLFTTERLKKNRENRLYLDYVQHAAGKTIIAPYSPRGNKDALVATPLYWGEVNDNLSIESFTVDNVVSRIIDNGDPFATYFEAKEKQNFTPVVEYLKNKTM